MGHKEYFVYITGKGSVEELFEIISKKTKLYSSEDYDIEGPSIIVYCKSKVLKDFTNGFDGLEKGTVGAVISPEEMSSDEFNDIILDIEDIEFSIFNIEALPEDYEKLFQDSELKIGNKTYYAKQIN